MKKEISNKLIWTRVAQVSGAFVFIISILLIVNFAQYNSIDPVETELINTLVDRLNQNPGDEQLREQVRALDLLSRKAYFTNQWQVRTGGYLLLLFKVEKVGNEYGTRVLQQFKPKDGIASEQQTPLLYKNHILTILPKDAGGNRNQFVCCSTDDCETILWTSGKSARYGLGPYIIADDKFFILKDDGTLTIAEARVDKFKELDKYKVMDGHDAWGPLAIANGKLLMRDSKKMLCLDIAQN